MLTSISNWIIGGLVAALLASGMYIAYDYKTQAAKIAKLEDQVASAKNAAKVAETNLSLRDGTIATLNARLKTNAAEAQRNCDLLQDAAQDKSPDADKPVGGVIGNILGKIDGDTPAPKKK